jgi:hypothetical protein
VAFKAEELTTKIFPWPAEGLWAVGCPQDTLGKDKPCAQSTHGPCPNDTHLPCDADTAGQCPEDTHVAPRRAEAGRVSGPLSLLQAQLREQLARGSAAPAP